MEVIFLPLQLLIHSLLIKRPVGWVYFLPLGAISSTWRSDIVVDVVAVESLTCKNGLLVSPELSWSSGVWYLRSYCGQAGSGDRIERCGKQ